MVQNNLHSISASMAYFTCSEIVGKYYYMDWLGRNRYYFQQMIRRFMIDTYLVIDNYLASPWAQYYYKILTWS